MVRSDEEIEVRGHGRCQSPISAGSPRRNLVQPAAGVADPLRAAPTRKDRDWRRCMGADHGQV